MVIELGRTLDEAREELVRCRTSDCLVLFYSSRGEVLPEVAPVSSPSLSIRHETEVGTLFKAVRRPPSVIGHTTAAGDMATYRSMIGVCGLSDVLEARFSRYSLMISGLPRTIIDWPSVRKWMTSPSESTVSY